MAEAVGVISAIIPLIQVWQAALGAGIVPTGKEHADLLNNYSFSMKILEDCVTDIKNAGEELVTPTIHAAALHCMRLGEELAYRQEKFIGPKGRKRIAYVLAPWDQLKSQYRDFRESVRMVHDLTQDLLLRKLQHNQESLMARYLEHENFTGMFIDRYLGKTKCSMDDRGDVESYTSRLTAFTVGQESMADIATLADQVITRSIAQGVQLDNSPSLVLGTITIVHEDKPRFVPVRAKYDTGADANFIPSEFVEKHNLASMLEDLITDGEDDNIFIGLNNEEYTIRHTVTLQWCASTMHHVRTTKFHVADNMPFDLLLGDPFIQENKVFHPQRVALPLRRKHRTSTQKAEEQRLTAEAEAKQAMSFQESRMEDKRQRDLIREAKKIAQSQTSASPMISASSSSRPERGDNPSILSTNPGASVDSPKSSTQTSMMGRSDSRGS